MEASARGIARPTGDYMGMLATVINSLAMQEALEQGQLIGLLASAHLVRISGQSGGSKEVRRREQGRPIPTATVDWIIRSMETVDGTVRDYNHLLRAQVLTLKVERSWGVGYAEERVMTETELEWARERWKAEPEDMSRWLDFVDRAAK